MHARALMVIGITVQLDLLLPVYVYIIITVNCHNLST